VVTLPPSYRPMEKSPPSRLGRHCHRLVHPTIQEHTIGKRATFLSFYIFLDTEEYNGAIFLCTENEKCMVNQ
jgi:hypothetical protein